ncbi:MAG: Gfo/Idh/MocA family oxidoreductase [Lentisphaeria bacterium]|nr:Gfo/Idh/MocA family oxidoreductase [Lentisphaeria bacterium]
MKSLRVGVIGQGRSGRNIHTEFLKNVPGKFTIVCVADVLKDRGERAEKEYGCESYTDYREMLKRDDLDLIVNATPSHLHPPVTKEILEAGFNVLCEKPLARRAADVDELIEVAKKAGKLFAIYQQSRFAPYYQQVCKVIESGVLGRIVMAKVAFNGFARRYDWQTLQGFNGGNLLNTGPHPMDQVLGIIGRDIMPKVWCQMERVNTYGDAEDFCKIILSHEGRTTIDLEVVSNAAYPSAIYELYGTYGSLKGTMGRIDWKYYIPEEAPEIKLDSEPLPGPSYCSDKLVWHERGWNVPSSQKDLFNSMGAKFYSNLYNAITKGEDLVIPPEQVRQQVAVIEECHRQNPLSKMGE